MMTRKPFASLYSVNLIGGSGLPAASALETSLGADFVLAVCGGRCFCARVRPGATNVHANTKAANRCQLNIGSSSCSCCVGYGGTKDGRILARQPLGCNA